MQVIVAEPEKATTADLIRLVEGFLTHNAPVRIGIVMSVNPDQTLRGYDDAGVAMLCAFNYVAQNLEGREDANYKALQFLVDVRTFIIYICFDIFRLYVCIMYHFSCLNVLIFIDTHTFSLFKITKIVYIDRCTPMSKVT